MCPSSEKVGTSLTLRYQGGYGYNGQAGSWLIRRDEIRIRETRITDITDPNNTVLFGDDKDLSSGGPGYLNAQLLSYNWAKDHPRIRHDFTANYGFADGHVENMTMDQFFEDGHKRGDRDYYLRFEKR